MNKLLIIAIVGVSLVLGLCAGYLLKPTQLINLGDEIGARQPTGQIFRQIAQFTEGAFFGRRNQAEVLADGKIRSSFIDTGKIVNLSNGTNSTTSVLVADICGSVSTSSVTRINWNPTLNHSSFTLPSTYNLITESQGGCLTSVGDSKTFEVVNTNTTTTGSFVFGAGASTTLYTSYASPSAASVIILSPGSTSVLRVTRFSNTSTSVFINKYATGQ